jgi:hypothetical protein
MAAILAVLSSIAVAEALARSGGATQAASCGVKRGAVKTLSDRRERLVNFKPRDTSIKRLRKKPAPNVGERTPRIKGVETTTYRVRAKLRLMRLEHDGDIRLVIGAPRHPSKTMIAAFPDPRCNGARSSPKRKAMSKARHALVAACGQPPSSDFADLEGAATLIGVGFFDLPHGQTGTAPNAIELHPVLAFKHASCRRRKGLDQATHPVDQRLGVHELGPDH